MLSIPQMRPDGVADTTHLAIFLRSQNCYNENDILNDVTRFSQMRRDASSVVEASDAGLYTISNYVTQLRTLIPRLEVKESELKTTFSWNDGFVAAKKESHANLSFDLAAFLWNLAAFESVKGVKIDRSTDEGIRSASRHFQQAAGYIEHLREQVLPILQTACTPPVSLPCLSENCLNMVKQLLLAQAQLCFYEKAVRDKKKDSMKSTIIAKLALQTSLFYSAASMATRAGNLSSVLDVSWFSITDFQAKCFLGAAEYWQALASKEQALQRGNGYGEEVARYNRAEQHIRAAIDFGRKTNLTSSLTAVAESLLNIILSSRNTAIHDLSTVYMEAVPSDSSLADITPVAMVKPSTLPEFSGASSSEDQPMLFRYVLPRAVIDANRRFYEQVNTMYSEAQTIATNATNFGKSTLSSVGLPGSLEVVKPESPLPEVLWQKIAKVQTMGGLDRLRNLLEDVKMGAKRALQTMGNIDETLDREENNDQNFHQRYPPYAATLSSQLNQDIRVNLKNLREAFANAQLNDSQLTQTIFSPATINNLSKLSQTREQLQALFPTSTAQVFGSVDLLDLGNDDTAASPTMSPTAKRLEEQLHLLAGVFETRQQVLLRLQALTQMDLLDTIQQALAANSVNNNISSIHGKYIQEAQTCMQEIQASVIQQEQMLQQILSLNEEFVQSKINDPLSKARNAVIQNLEEAVVQYLQLHGQVSSGQTFYSNLQSKLTTLQQSADDLSYTQQWQRQEFEQSLMDIAVQQQQQKLQQQQFLKQQQEHDLALKFSQQSLSSGVNTTTSSTTDIYGNVPALTTSSSASSTPSPFAVNNGGAGIAMGTPVSLTHAMPTSPTVTVSNYPSTAAVPTPAPVSPTPTYQYNSHSYMLPPNTLPAVSQVPPPQQQQQAPAGFPMTPNIVTPPPVAAVSPPPPPSAGYNQFQSNTGFNPAYASMPSPYMATPPPPQQQQPPASQPVPVAMPPSYQPMINQLMEMGFSQENATNAIVSSQGDEELALAMLLSAGSEPTTAQNSSGVTVHTTNAPPPKPPKSGGFFSWGKKHNT